MTGTFQIKKQNDGGVQELREYNTKDVLLVGDPVALDTDGTVIAYGTGDEILGVNDSQMAAPEFYSQTDLDAIATTAVQVLISPVKEGESEVEVLPSVAITAEATIEAVIGHKLDFNVSNELILGTPGTDAQVVDYMVYTAKDGTLTINPIVIFLDAVFG
jgi:hypothetical protein